MTPSCARTSVIGALVLMRGFRAFSIHRYIHLANPSQFQRRNVATFANYPSALTITTSTIMANTAAFLEATKIRRSYYQLLNESPISDARIQELVRHAISHVPSAFNSQTTRVVVLLKSEHEKLWDAATDVYKASLPEEQFKRAEQKFNLFRAAYGTVRRNMEWHLNQNPIADFITQILFYEDTAVVREFQEKFQTYEDKFLPCTSPDEYPQLLTQLTEHSGAGSEQTNGMHQYFRKP